MYPVVCTSCGQTGQFGRITASLSCPRCQTGDHLDLNDKTAAADPNHSGGGNGATGWTESRPNVLEGWDEYQGPAVGPNPEAQDHLVGDLSAYNDGSWTRGNPGFNPGGGYEKSTWHMGPTTSQPAVETYDEHTQGPESGGARWQGKKESKIVPIHVTLPNGSIWEGVGKVVKATRSSSDPMGSVEEHLKGVTYADPKAEGYRAPQKPSHSNKAMAIDAQCPNCGNSKTHIDTDSKGDGWWACPKCGSLANVDKTGINPHDPGFGFTPDRSMKPRGEQKAAAKSSLLGKVAVIKKANNGLSNSEALNLAIASQRRWGN